MVSFEDDIKQALTVLQSGGLILYPTDTVWGIGCDATHAGAVARIFSLKNRPDQKAMIVLVAEERDVLRYTASPDLRVFDYLRQSARPTTVIYPQAVGLAENLVAPDGSIAIRICRDPFCKSLLKRFRKPLVSTSANLSGNPSPAGFADIDPRIRAGVDYVVKYRQTEKGQAAPSRLIQWNPDGSVTVLRE
ncbi:MAG TPA: L-threonylcarbamoyladenylate synthase [Chitinophagaceae bacterium]|nr:L-threonylcarbamoyladenylate synthase [Chitinophagaceae bacterium]